MRGLRLLAYFQQCFGRGFSSFPFREARLFMETALQLVCHRPYVVSASDVTVLHLHSEVSEHNGSQPPIELMNAPSYAASCCLSVTGRRCGCRNVLIQTGVNLLPPQVPKCLSLCSINGALVGLGVSATTLDSPDPEEDGEQQPVCIGFGEVASGSV